MIVDSLPKGAPHLPSALWIVPSVGAIPAAIITFGPLLVWESQRSSVKTLGRTLKALPRLVLGGALAVVVAAVLTVALTVPRASAGQPEATASGYQLDSRSGAIPITQAEYQQDLAASQRVFAAFGVALNTLVATVACGRRRRRVLSKDPTTEG